MRSMPICVLLAVSSLTFAAQESATVQAAEADARRMAQRQCDYVLAIGRMQKAAVGSADRAKAEREAEGIARMAQGEEERNQRYRTGLKLMSVDDRSTVEQVFQRTLMECGTR